MTDDRWARRLVCSRTGVTAPLDEPAFLSPAGAPWLVEYDLDPEKGEAPAPRAARPAVDPLALPRAAAARRLRRPGGPGRGGDAAGPPAPLRAARESRSGSRTSRAIRPARSRPAGCRSPSTARASWGRRACSSPAPATPPWRSPPTPPRPACRRGWRCRRTRRAPSSTRCRDYGAEVLSGPGTLVEAAKLLEPGKERFWTLSTLREPYRVEGKKTMGLELAEQLGWELPDWIVYPLGGGTGIVGMHKAFAELERLGLIGPQRPRFVVVQAAGCAPIVRAWEAGEDAAAPWENPDTRVWGLRVPRAIGDFLVLRALRETGGRAIAVDEKRLDGDRRLDRRARRAADRARGGRRARRGRGSGGRRSLRAGRAGGGLPDRRSRQLCLTRRCPGARAAAERAPRGAGRRGVVSAAVALVGTREEIEIEEAVGRDGVPAGIATRFDYASLTKPFVATLALVLDAEGVAAAGDSDRRRLARGARAARPAAPRRSAPPPLGAGGVDAALPRAAGVLDEAVELIVRGGRDGDLVGARAGTYSDLGFILWGRTAERRLGAPLLDAAPRARPRAAGDGRGGGDAGGAAGPGRVPHGHRPGGEAGGEAGARDAGPRAAAAGARRRTATPVFWLGSARPAGTPACSAAPRDLWRLGAEWLAPGRLLKPEGVAAALGGGGRFALGWWRRTLRGSAGRALSPAAFGHHRFRRQQLLDRPGAGAGSSCSSARGSIRSIDMNRWRRRFHSVASARRA